MKRKLLVVLTAVGVFTLILLAVRFYILSRIKDKLESQLVALRDSGYVVKYDSITVNTKKNEVNIYKLVIKRSLDSAECNSTDFFSARYIKAEGFKFIPLLLKKRLSFESITVDSSKMVLHPKFFGNGRKNKADAREFSITINKLNFPHLRFSYLDSASCKPNTTFTSSAQIKGFALSFFKDRKPYFNLTSFNADSVNIVLPTEFYSITIKESRLNLEHGILDLDTIRIIPHLGKVAFGIKKNMEIDRIEGVIPYLNMYGLTVYKEDSLGIKAKKLTTQFFLKVFRDKRQPFRNPYRPLPAEALAKISAGIDIDSVIVNKSYVEYEEFAEEADSAGRIFFDNVFASIKNVHNLQAKADDKMEMRATGRLYGQGKLKVHAVIPLNAQAETEVKGTLQDFDFAKMNVILEPQARIRAESGRLHDMDFAFHYDNDQSDGTLHMVYEDLRMVSFRTDEQIEKKLKKKRRRKSDDDERDEKIEKAPVKTFVLNAFILKNNPDKNFREERSGTISFTRDKRRSIFNYWAKSMLSGLKSAYKIDKLEDSRLKKMLEKKD